MISSSIDLTWSAASFWSRSVFSSPYRRVRGGSPATKCRSEPFLARTSRRYSSMRFGAAGGASLPVSCMVSVLTSHPLRHVGLEYGRAVGDVTGERALVDRVDEGVLRVDLAQLDRGEQRLVHRLHADVLAGLPLRREHVGLVGRDQLADR